MKLPLNCYFGQAFLIILSDGKGYEIRSILFWFHSDVELYVNIGLQSDFKAEQKLGLGGQKVVSSSNWNPLEFEFKRSIFQRRLWIQWRGVARVGFWRSHQNWKICFKTPSKLQKRVEYCIKFCYLVHPQENFLVQDPFRKFSSYATVSSRNSFLQYDEWGGNINSTAHY